MDNLTYEPIRDDLNAPATKAELLWLYERMLRVEDRMREPEAGIRTAPDTES